MPEARAKPAAREGKADEEGGAGEKDGGAPLSLEELKQADIIGMAKDKVKSRLLQRSLLRGGQDVSELVVSRAEPHFMDLVRDQYGNYLAQRILEVATPDQFECMFAKLKPELISLAHDVNGTGAVQKGIEQGINRSKVAEIVEALSAKDAAPLARSVTGFHVVGRLVELLPASEVEPYIEQLCGTPEKALSLAKDQWGCCVVKKCIDRSVGNLHSKIATAITNRTLELVQDPFGNYVVQHLVQSHTAKPNPYVTRVIDSLKGKVFELSLHKFSSNVLEKCLVKATDKDRNKIINEILNPPNYQPSEAVQLLVFHKYGNYVFQSALEGAKDPQFSSLIEHSKYSIHSAVLVCETEAQEGKKTEDTLPTETAKRLATKLLKKYPALSVGMEAASGVAATSGWEQHGVDPYGCGAYGIDRWTSMAGGYTDWDAYGFAAAGFQPFAYPPMGLGNAGRSSAVGSRARGQGWKSQKTAGGGAASNGTDNGNGVVHASGIRTPTTFVSVDRSKRAGGMDARAQWSLDARRSPCGAMMDLDPLAACDPDRVKHSPCCTMMAPDPFCVGGRGQEKPSLCGERGNPSQLGSVGIGQMRHSVSVAMMGPDEVAAGDPCQFAPGRSGMMMDRVQFARSCLGQVRYGGASTVVDPSQLSEAGLGLANLRLQMLHGIMREQPNHWKGGKGVVCEGVRGAMGCGGTMRKATIGSERLMREEPPHWNGGNGMRCAGMMGGKSTGCDGALNSQTIGREGLLGEEALHRNDVMGGQGPVCAGMIGPKTIGRDEMLGGKAMGGGCGGKGTTKTYPTVANSGCIMREQPNHWKGGKGVVCEGVRGAMGCGGMMRKATIGSESLMREEPPHWNGGNGMRCAGMMGGKYTGCDGALNSQTIGREGLLGEEALHRNDVMGGQGPFCAGMIGQKTIGRDEMLGGKAMGGVCGGKRTTKTYPTGANSGCEDACGPKSTDRVALPSDGFRKNWMLHPADPDEYKPIILQDGVRVQFPPPTAVVLPPAPFGPKASSAAPAENDASAICCPSADATAAETAMAPAPPSEMARSTRCGSVSGVTTAVHPIAPTHPVEKARGPPHGTTAAADATITAVAAAPTPQGGHGNKVRRRHRKHGGTSSRKSGAVRSPGRVHPSDVARELGPRVTTGVACSNAGHSGHELGDRGQRVRASATAPEDDTPCDDLSSRDGKGGRVAPIGGLAIGFGAEGRTCHGTVTTGGEDNRLGSTDHLKAELEEMRDRLAAMLSKAERPKAGNTAPETPPTGPASNTRTPSPRSTTPLLPSSDGESGSCSASCQPLVGEGDRAAAHPPDEKVPAVPVITGKGKAPPPPPPVGSKGKASPPQGKASGKAPPPAYKGKGKSTTGGFLKQATSKDQETAEVVDVRKSKTKPLGWSKLKTEVEGEFWNSAHQENDGVEVPREELEALFAWAAEGKPKAKAESTRKKAAAQAGGNISLVSSARSMTISIHLHGLRQVSPQDVRTAIFALDDGVLTPDVTEMLLVPDTKTGLPVVLPTFEEAAAAKTFMNSGQSSTALDFASQFILIAHDIPNLKDRLLLQKFRCSFDTRVGDLRSQLHDLTGAMRQVRDSESFAHILKVVLKTGNILNHGTQRGNAAGFHMESLAALSQVKQATDDKASLGEDADVPKGHTKQLSLLEHLVRVVSEQRPQLLNVSCEMPLVPVAARVDLREVESEVRGLRSELARVASTIRPTQDTSSSKAAAVASTGAPSASANSPSDAHDADGHDVPADKFLELAPDIVKRATQELGELTDAVEVTAQTYKDLAIFFGERRPEVSSSMWLGFVQKFLVEWTQAAKSHRASVEKEAQKIKRRASLVARRTTSKDCSLSMGRYPSRNMGSPSKKEESLEPVPESPSAASIG